MKHFLRKTIYFLLPILFIGIILEVLLWQIPNDYKFKKEFLDKNTAEIETFILGSSHSFYGLNPLFFEDKAFNGSHVSQSLYYDFQILMKYEENLKNLNTIILPISYFSLYQNLGEGKEGWRTKKYLQSYNIGISNSILDYSEIFTNQMNNNVKKLYSYYIKKAPQITCSNFGWGTNYSSKKARDLNKTGKSASERHTKNISSDKYQHFFEDNINTLDSIIEWCESKGIKVLVFTPPAYETYRQNLNKDQLDITIRTAEEICSKYKKCSYINFLYDDNFIAEDYFDADHLSEIGAKKLSLLINKIIK